MDDDHTTPHRPRNRSRGIGTVIACFAAAFVIAAIVDDDEPRVNRAEARALMHNDAAFDNAAERETTDADIGNRVTFRINKGHVIIEPTNGDMKVDMSDALRQRTSVKTTGQRTIISVDDDYDEDVKIKIAVPASAACHIELAAGLLEIKRPPCQNNDLTVRSGKMDVHNVPKNHGILAGAVSVGSVTINGANGKQSKSAGVGELHATLPAAGDGPSVTARVNVGMLTVDVD